MNKTQQPDVPCLPNSQLRKHPIGIGQQERILHWLSENGGVVIYVPYPNDVQHAISVVPLHIPTDNKDLPGDNYLWDDGEIVHNDEGKRLRIAPRVLTRTKKGELVHMLAADCVLPDFETEEGSALLDKVFRWT